jgi:hypothetical protein
MGANPLSIDQMRLLASYPTHDDNAVFLGNFDFLVRKSSWIERLSECLERNDSWTALWFKC